jgi:hypothetical protein|tara:strand:+ start:705 stop:875 length:171 start_codon:yes stop_codon:yes gene_type:complete
MTDLMFQDFTAAEFAQFFDSPSHWETWTKTKVRRSVQLKGSSKAFKELVILKMETL